MSEPSDWKIRYDQYKPEHEHLREALCTLGNGYFACRGAAEEAHASHDFTNEPHYPGTYIAGCFNRLKSEVEGEVIENESLVNWPQALFLTFINEDGNQFSLADVEILDYEQVLDLHCGLLYRSVSFRDQQGRESTLNSKRVVSMTDPHMAAIEWQLTADNWSGNITLVSGIDGNVKNRGVPRYSELKGQHLQILEKGNYGEDCLYMLSETNQSGIRLAQAIRTEAFYEEQPYTLKRRYTEEENQVLHYLDLHLERKKTLTVHKKLAFFNSLDRATSNIVDDATRKVSSDISIQEIFDSQHKAWESLWERSDIMVEADNGVQLLLRLHIFHLLQVASLNTLDLDVSVPSRGLHGEAYRGNIMWDELFIFPVINYLLPNITRNLLKYRYHRMDEARRAARLHGYEGAMFPWQSGSNGQENAQEIHLNPDSGNWIPDDTHLQRHVNAAIAYNYWRYYEISQDSVFLEEYGLEVFLEITKFWASKVEFDHSKERYVILQVVGPDEYHTSYPDSDQPGLNNNAYTNVMVAWLMRKALQLYQAVPEMVQKMFRLKLNISKSDLDKWDDISSKMYVPFLDKNIIEQFEGYGELEEFDWESMKKKYGDISRLDRVLEKEGDTPNRYKAGKQADVLMLFYLFSESELADIFSTLGYDFDPKMIQKNIEYYEQRTSHGSTLSRLVFSWVSARADHRKSWNLFEEALHSDFKDIQGGTTPEGIHLGAMAGTIDMVQRCFTGLYVDNEGVPWINPVLPKEIYRLKLTLHYRQQCFCLDISHKDIMICYQDGWSEKMKIGVVATDKVYELKRGDSKEVKLGKLKV
ncbi:MAG: glycoside hydrolase family 65 protein [Cyclobacteriaceae bacterium]